MNSSKEISRDLRDLVSQSVKLLGNAVKEIYGPELYETIDSLRKKMKSVRGKEAETVHSALETVYVRLKNEKTADLSKIAKAFALMLELINASEAAYRSFRLKDLKLKSTLTPHSLVYVFTSHPTEARSREFLYLTDKVEVLLLNALEDGFDSISDKLFHLLRIALRINLANTERPQVKDEAEQIFHTVLDEDILTEQVSLRQKGIDVYFRTWVGGDKDGHPKVGPSTMLQSLNLSRLKIMDFVNVRLKSFEEDLNLIEENGLVLKHLIEIKKLTKNLQKVQAGDGRKIKSFKQKVLKLITFSEKNHMLSPALKEVEVLFWLYPALVLPLEIREDQELIHAALSKPSMTIAKMLDLLKEISQGLDGKWYVRGFVISMCQSADDVIAAAKLTKKCCGSLIIPIVPLFENEKGLSNSREILLKTFETFPLKDEHHKKWGGRFEVMLGYSDSSKENGVLPGRFLVERSLLNLEEFLISEGLTPVFFHGSGGSLSRGGGPIKEQIAWLPQSALNIYKVTVQGETVQRNFSQAVIMRSQVAKIVQEFSEYKPKKKLNPKTIIPFAQDIQNSYRELVQNPDFQELVTLATPYEFLNLLRIGSRPTKRNKEGKFTLRAIPWILCWTQTRLLLPIWWGVGHSWKKRSEKEKQEIKKYAEQSPLMQTYLKNLGFTLAKMELGVWKFQLFHSKLSQEEKDQWYEKMIEELNLTKSFLKEMTKEDSYTWFNERLGQSIYFRSSMIHPLNVIQRISLEREDNALLRETVTGIACGMLTTG
jgi:phosphoenolpyruvate carboxylase